MRLKPNCNEKNIKNTVTASGSISSSKMTLTQSVINKSNTLPNYKVAISYNWKTPYTFCVSTDQIVTAWGGGLNSKDYVGTAYYYGWTSPTNWTSELVTRTSMSSTVKPNVGIQYSFPQSKGKDKQGHMTKTKMGAAGFTLYQTKKSGKETNLISNYCHKVIKVGGGSISISASGPSVSISIGPGWDKSPQAKNVIKY